MTQIVGIHGVGNYHPHQSAEALSAMWTTSLLAGFPGDRPELDVAVAYYAPTLQLAEAQGADDPDHLPAPVQAAIGAWLEQVAAFQGEVQGPATRRLRAALEWFATSRGLDSRIVTLFASTFFREVITYLDPGHADRREEAQRIVAETIATHRPRIVIAHSLGSVVAWESLWSHSPAEPIDLLLTLGSPLAMPNIIYEKLHHRPPAGLPGRPPSVKRWVNLADQGDLVAVPRLLARYFRGVDTDLEPTIGVFDFHRVKSYLASPTTAAIISTTLDKG